MKCIPLENTKIKIDGRSGRQNMLKTITYLRHAVGINKDGAEIKFEDSCKNNLLQMADLIAGAINRSLNRDKTDANVYIKIIKDKIKIIKDISR